MLCGPEEEEYVTFKDVFAPEGWLRPSLRKGINLSLLLDHYCAGTWTVAVDKGPVSKKLPIPIVAAREPEGETSGRELVPALVKAELETRGNKHPHMRRSPCHTAMRRAPSTRPTLPLRKVAITSTGRDTNSSRPNTG